MGLPYAPEVLSGGFRREGCPVLRPPPLRPILLAVALASLTATLLPTGSAAVLATDGPIAHWTFDEGTGSVAADSVGDADGTLAGTAAWSASGAAGTDSALTLDGGGYVDITATDGLQPPVVFLTAWVRSATPPSGRQVIAELGGSTCGNPSFGLYAVAGGVALGDPDAEDWSDTLWPDVHPWDGQWHIVHLRMGSGVPARLGIDGIWNEMNGQLDYAGATDDRLRIGAPIVAGCDIDAFTGHIDDVRLYDRADVDVEALVPPITPTVELQIPASPRVSTWTTIEATVSPAPYYAIVEFEELASGQVVSTQLMQRVSAGRYRLDYIFGSTGRWTVRARVRAFGYLEKTDDAAFNVVRTPTTSTLTVTGPTPLRPKTTLSLTSTIGHAPLEWYKPTGVVRFFRDPGPNETMLGMKTVADDGTATLQLPNGLDVGAHTIEARYGGDPRFAPSSKSATVTIPRDVSFVHISEGPVTVETHSEIVLAAGVGANIDGWDASTMSFFTTGTGASRGCLVPVSPTNRTVCRIPSLPIGSYWFKVRYAGNADIAPSTSSPAWKVTVTPDTVHAAEIGVDLGSFYPYKDGYRDTLGVKGKRREPISVGIKIYGPSGSLVKEASIPEGTGSYRYTWNGRNAAGAILAGGTYKVVQTLTDRFGTTLTNTSFVGLSRKKLVIKTEYVTKNGNAISSKGDPGSGSIAASSKGYVKLVGKGFGGWVGVGYQFTIPAATVYKSIAFQVYTNAILSVPPNDIGMQNFETCPTLSGDWSLGCFDQLESIGRDSGALTWRSTSGSVTANRTDRTVRGMVSVYSSTVYIYKVRVKVVYGVLE